MFQALPLGQQLEAKPPTGPLAGVETVPVPVPTVAAASVPAASTAAASGQAPPTSAGTVALDSHHIRNNSVSNNETKVFSRCLRTQLQIHPPTSLTSPLGITTTLRLAFTTTPTAT